MIFLALQVREQACRVGQRLPRPAMCTRCWRRPPPSTTSSRPAAAAQAVSQDTRPEVRNSGVRTAVCRGGQPGAAPVARAVGAVPVGDALPPAQPRVPHVRHRQPRRGAGRQRSAGAAAPAGAALPKVPRHAWPPALLDTGNACTGSPCLSHHIARRQAEAMLLGQSRGKEVRVMVHHSRNTEQKQWDETVVIALGGMARLLRAPPARHRRHGPCRGCGGWVWACRAGVLTCLWVVLAGCSTAQQCPRLF